jgi:protein-disulfide isomerase
MHKIGSHSKFWGVASLVIVAALMVSACAAPGLPASPQASQADATPAAAQADTGVAKPPAEGSDVRSKGSEDAPVTIVEYSDFQCPFCSRFFEQTHGTLIKEYVDTGKVRLQFRDFPLANLHPNAQSAAVASRCAAEQGVYWEMHDKLFGSQAEWSGLADPKETFAGYAAALGIDPAAFATCLTSGKFDQAIQDDMAAGQAAGVGGTPSFVINGELFVGAQPIDAFRQAIDTVLAGGTLAAAQPTPVPAGPPQPVDIPLGDAPVKGDPNAPMTIVEYSDFQCPFCARFASDTLGTLIDEYVATGKAKLVYKDFPLEQIHPQAAKAAEASRCVRELGGDEAYWAMHDRLFAGQQEWSGNTAAADIFARYAGEVGVDAAKVKACVDSGQYTQAVQADLQEGLQLGVQGTPTFFLDGQVFVGAQPIDNFRQAIAMVERGENIVPPTPAPPTPEPTPAPLTEDIPLDDAAGIKGSASAPVTIVEYSDYQCPFCERHFQQVLPQLQEYIDNGTVRYVFKDFPLTQIHPQAPKAAEAARCAGDQDYYWQMHDLLFQNQQQWSGQANAVDIFKQFAGQLKLDQAAFDQCLDSGKHAAVIAANEQEGLGYGVRGTPGFFVNRTLLAGAYPIESFEQLIQQALAEKNQ